MTTTVAAAPLHTKFRWIALAGVVLAVAALLGAGGSMANAVPPPASQPVHGLTADSNDDAMGGAPAADSLVEIQLLGMNDFHGHLEAKPSQNIAGAAVLAGAVSQLRSQNPNTVFMSAGDNVGGTPFASFIAQDEPTIRALVSAGLEVSSVGNHEFDRGYLDLTDRIMPSYGTAALTLGANVRLTATGEPALPEYTIVDRSGVKIGVIGVVTEETATAVTPNLVQNLDFVDQLQAASEVADRIADDVDITVLLTHDGSFSTDCASIAAENSSFGELVRGMNGKVDAIFSGHTHTAYACDVGGVPVVSSGLYGGALSQVSLGVDALTGEVREASSALIPLVKNGTAQFAADPVVANIVADAVAAAEAQGSEPIGRISASILRGGTPSGSDRGVESSLGNLIADVMSMRVPDADFAIVNPGSLREDLLFSGDGTVTYRDVASVQPFGSTLVAMTLTAADLRETLEAQWYVDGGLPLKRHLAVSEEFSYSYDPNAASGSRIATLTLRGNPLDDDDTVRIVTNAFLAGGGDGFSTFTRGLSRVDTGYNDLQVTVEHFQANAVVDPPAIGRAVVERQPAPDPQPDPSPQPGPEPTPGPSPDPASVPPPQREIDPAGSMTGATLAQTGAASSLNAVWLAGMAAAMVIVGLVLRRKTR